MIVLSVIAVLTAILLPTARNAMPNESLMKFKKAHNALYSVISELVNSDKYYLDGDLGVKSDGNNANEPMILCSTMGDVLNAQKINCSDVKLDKNSAHLNLDWAVDGTGNTIEDLKKLLDKYCKDNVQ